MIIDFDNEKERRNREEFEENIDRYNLMLDAFINEELKTEKGIDLVALAFCCSDIVGDCLYQLKEHGVLQENLPELIVRNIFDVDGCENDVEG